MIHSVTPDAEVELVREGGGRFEIEKDGQLAFSKKAVGRFPEEAEIKDLAG